MELEGDRAGGRWPLLQLNHAYQPIQDYMAFSATSVEVLEAMISNLQAIEERIAPGQAVHTAN